MKQIQRFLSLALSFLLSFGLLMPAVGVPDAVAIDGNSDRMEDRVKGIQKDEEEAGTVAAAATVTVYVDGKKLRFDQPPIMKNGHTLVPVRAIFEALGAEVEWDPSAKQVMSTKGDVSVLLTINSTTMRAGTIGGTATDKTLDVAPTILNNRVLVPLRAVSEAFDCDVSWNGALKRIDIYTKAESDQSDDSFSDEDDKSDYIQRLLQTLRTLRDSSGGDNKPDSSSKNNQIETSINNSDSVAVNSNRIYFNPSHRANGGYTFYNSAVYEGNTLYFNFIFRPEVYVYDGSAVRSFNVEDFPRDIIVRNGQVYYYGHANKAVYHLDTANGNWEVLFNQDGKVDVENLTLYRNYLLVSGDRSTVYAINVNTGESKRLYDSGEQGRGILVTAAGGKVFIYSYLYDGSVAECSIVEANLTINNSKTLYTDVNSSLLSDDRSGMFCAADGSGIYFYGGDEDESKVYYFHNASTNKRQVVSESEYNNAKTAYNRTNNSCWQDDWTFDSNVNNGVYRKSRRSEQMESLYNGKGCVYLTNNQSQVAFIQGEIFSAHTFGTWGHTSVHVMDINGKNRQEIINNNNNENSDSSSSGGGTHSSSSSSGDTSTVNDTCNLCNGIGVVTCYYCHGSGQARPIEVLGIPTPQKCTYCGGTGKRLCPGCYGSGKKGGAK